MDKNIYMPFLPIPYGLGLGRRKCLWEGSTQFLDAIYRHIDDEV
jgi:hypothetical protein